MGTLLKDTGIRAARSFPTGLLATVLSRHAGLSLTVSLALALVATIVVFAVTADDEANQEQLESDSPFHWPPNGTKRFPRKGVAPPPGLRRRVCANFFPFWVW